MQICPNYNVQMVESLLLFLSTQSFEGAFFREKVEVVLRLEQWTVSANPWQRMIIWNCKLVDLRLAVSAIAHFSELLILYQFSITGVNCVWLSSLTKG